MTLVLQRILRNFSAFLFLMLPGVAFAQGAPSFTALFSPDSISAGNNSSLTFTITEISGSPAETLAFSATLPTGVTIASGSQSNSCDGVFTATSGSASLSLSAGRLGASQSCVITLPVTSTTVAAHTFTSGDLTSDQGNSGSATDILTVTAASGSNYNKSFSPAAVDPGSVSTLTYTFDIVLPGSPAPSDWRVPSFTETLPAGLQFPDPTATTNSCTGTLTVDRDAGELDFSGGVISTGGTTTCTITAQVQGVTQDSYDVENDLIIRDAFGALISQDTASADLTVNPGPVDGIDLIKAFDVVQANAGSTVTLDFTLTNTSRDDSATSIAFSDLLDTSFLSGTVFASLNSNSCGGTVVGTGTDTFDFSGGSLAANGASCTISIEVDLPAGAADGTHTNTTTAVTGLIGSTPYTGDTASTTLRVLGLDAQPPVFSKSFTDDPVAPSGTVTLRYDLSNPNPGQILSDMTFIDNISAITGSTGISINTVPGTDPCGVSSSVALIFIDDDVFGVELTAGTLAASDSCSFDVTLDIDSDVAPADYVSTSGDVTATVSGNTVIASGASDTLQIEGGANLSFAKEFTETVLGAGQSTTLTFLLTSAPESPSTATGLTFTDDLSSFLAGATFSTNSDNCGGSPVLSAGDTLLTYSGGSLAPDASCTIDVTVTLPGSLTNGTYTNTTSTLTGTAGGESLVVSAASDDLQILTAEPLQLTKSFSPAEALPGEAVTLTYTLTNPDPTFAYAVSFFTESYSSALSSLAATSMPAGGFCGGSSTASGTTLGIFTSLDIAAGDSCSFDVPLLVPVGAVDGSYSSVTSSINATVDGNAVVLPAVGASFSVNSAQVELSKSYSDDTLAPGDTVTVDYVLTNLSSTQALSALAFTDNLDAQLSGLVATDTPIISTCGGGSLSGTSTLSFSGGTLAASASCTISVTQQVPGGASASIYSGTTSGVTGTASGLAITGPAVSAAFTVTSFELPSFSKSFSDPVLGAGGSTTLTYVITNNDGSTTLSGLRFSDDLDAALTGFSVTGGTGSNLCGTGSTVSGTSEVLLEDGTLAPGDSCNIVLTVAVPAGATTGGYPGATSTLTENGEFAASAASATLTIEPAPGFSKDFASSSIVQGDVSTLTFTLDNSAASVAASSLDFTDNLPAGLTVASPANASTTCTGGTLTATTGTASISYTGGSAAAGASCTVSADVRATSSGTLVNTSGDLTSFLGNSGTATATLSVSAAPVPGFAKAFSDDSIAQGGSTPLTFTIDNSAALMEASSLDFTDNLPTGLTVASPANASTTCTGGTLTATAGAASISYTGGSTAIGASCTVSADVTAATTGSLVNTSGDLTSSLGNSGTATATLKVPGLSLDSPIASDDVVNSAEAPAVTFSGSTTQIEDGETVSVTVTDSASATVSGSATVASDAWSLALDLSSLADGALTVTADAADASGSSAPQVSASFSKNTNTPSLAFDSPLAGDDIVSAAESATVTISGTSSGVPDGETVSVTVTDSASATVSGNTTAASDAWSLVLDLSSLAEGSLTVTADAADGAGNPVVQISTTLSHDLNPPTGYSASFDQDPVNNSNESAASFTFASAETGTSYAYTISSDGGGSDVTGSGTIASATDQITGIDLSGLGDGTLTLSVVLTDSANQAGTAATDTTTKNTDAPTVTLSGPTDAQSDPFTVDLTFGEAVTGLAASALIIDNGTASDLTGSGTSYSVTITPDHDGTVTLSLPAGSAQDSTGNGNLVSNEIEVIADLTGTPDPNPDPDADGDGIPDNLESSTADRDGDGIVDSADYDPQGYFYCEDDGRILSGGGITVTGPSGSNSSVGISNNINILRDGSTGEYQWFALVPGNYSVSYSYPSTGVASTARLSSGSLDVTSLLPANPAVLGSTEVGSTGVLADTSLSANPAFYDSFVIEAGDPNVLANNIPMTQCSAVVTLSANDNGAEANGGSTDSVGFTVSLSPSSSQDTVISYSLGGSATSGTDFVTPTGSVTVVAGDTSATIELTVLEDGLIEGSETLTLTLTAVTSGAPGVTLSTTTSDLTRSSTITDDDFAVVSVANDDLTASENGTDTAAMSFVLLGQPTQDVQLAFAGDAQCNVSPATLTFGAGNYSSAQTLTITAIDDAVVEGTHSCQPTVTVSSTDTNFDGFALALAQVAIADDLVDQIREPLSEILENDLEETIRTQQRYFSGISKGALSRLQAGQDGLGCGTVAPLDVDGSVNIQDGTGQSDGTFGYDVYDCNTGSREILAGAFSITHTENIGTQALFQFSHQRERLLSETHLQGRFWGGYVSRTNVTDLADGSINGLGVNGGIYGAHQLGEGLFIDYYAAGALGHHRYKLSFDATPAVISTEGSYDYLAAFGGVALSGEHAFETFMLRPRAGIDLAYAVASDADVTATQLGQTDTGSIDIPNTTGGRIFAELEFSNLANPEGGNPFARQIQTALAPRFACESSSNESGVDCGLGIAFSRSVFDPHTGVGYSFEIDYEHIDETDRLSVDFHRERRFFNDRGAVVTQLSVSASDAVSIQHGVRLDF